jgi:hypothetical protein
MRARVVSRLMQPDGQYNIMNIHSFMKDFMIIINHSFIYEASTLRAI